MAPFGSLTLSGLVAIVLSAVGASVTRKWLVAPLSSMAQFFNAARSKLTVFSRLFAACAYLALVVGVLLGKIVGWVGFSECV